MVETVEETILELEDEEDDDYIYIPRPKKKCNEGHWHTVKACIFCGRKDIIYREPDRFDVDTRRLLLLDITTGESHWYLARRMLKEYFPTLSFRQILNPDKRNLNAVKDTKKLSTNV